jgi:phosphoglycolate phosphatase-like HAD superfamily hydrolase
VIENYKTLIFDCDGVILNSNKIKTQAFFDATKHLGYEVAKALQDYHVKNGGISRYAKFEHFITEILNQDFDEVFYHELLQRFAQSVKKGLMNCEVAEGLDELREKTVHANWLIVSGGDQAELREVFAVRGLNKYFNGGIFGSPDDKDAILKNETKNCNIIGRSLFLGDSKYDYQAANMAKMDFIFISNWTEVKDWKKWICENEITNFKNIGSITS